jgi:hypothetical protein
LYTRRLNRMINSQSWRAGPTRIAIESNRFMGKRRPDYCNPSDCANAIFAGNYLLDMTGHCGVHNGTGPVPLSCQAPALICSRFEVAGLTRSCPASRAQASVNRITACFISFLLNEKVVIKGSTSKSILFPILERNPLMTVLTAQTPSNIKSRGENAVTKVTCRIYGAAMITITSGAPVCAPELQSAAAV